MKRIFNVYTLTLNDGHQLAVGGQDNKVVAFDAMRLMFPLETEGYTFRDLEVRYGGTKVQ